MVISDDSASSEKFDRWADAQGARFELISKCAYMTGVYESIFDNPLAPPRREWFDVMDDEKNARVIRHLCMLRTSIWKNFQRLQTGMRAYGKGILDMPEHIPIDSVNQLAEDGVEIRKGLSSRQRDLSQVLVFINQQIKNRIGNCRGYFPDWIRWEWLQDIFLVPDGENPEGLKRAFNRYCFNKKDYPYTNYINIPPGDQSGIFSYDEVFVKALYGWHGEEFNDSALVSDAGSSVKNRIEEFFEGSESCSAIVDCENSDPYALCAMLKGMGMGNDSPITNMLLVDDVNASSSWAILKNYVGVPVERILLKRVKEDKSRTDVFFAASVCNAIYREHADSVVIVSSDSDYYGLIEALPDVRFLVLMEHGKSSPALTEALRSRDVPYAYINDFSTEGSDDLRRDAVLSGVADEIKGALDLDLNAVMDRVLHNTRVSMPEEEVKRLIRDRIARKITLEVSDDNRLSLDFRPLTAGKQA